MDSDEARRRFAAARVARLATVRPEGRPHVVPVTFAMTGPDTIVWAVDHKPKRTFALQRLRNIAAEPRVSLLADHYTDDWTRLWWVRADGHAAIVGGDDERAAAVAALAERYGAYRRRPPRGPVVTVGVDSWTGWSAAPPVADAQPGRPADRR